jgi:hypothetical protein
VLQKLGALANFQIFSPYFGPNLHFTIILSRTITIFQILDTSVLCLLSYLSHQSVLKVYCPYIYQTQPEVLWCARNQVRPPIFGIFHQSLALIYI